MVSGKKVIGFSPRIFLKCGDDCPVVAVSWDETQKFIKKLNELEGTDRLSMHMKGADHPVVVLKAP